MTNPNGYDFTIGNSGFRFATDTNSPYQRYTEPVTAQRFDNSKEPGEQSLSALPWIKSQDSFHGGAGQLNLEKGYTDFQYQQEQVGHLRFDASLGVDVWTPGKVTRLPDTLFTEAGFGPRCAITAAINNTDYAIVGGAHGLCQMKWENGPDSAPTVTNIDLSGAPFGGATNCNFYSITTDGANYYALCQLENSKTSILTRTYVIKGDITSIDAPLVIYDVPMAYTQTIPPDRTNYIKNPSFESAALTPWVLTGATSSTATVVTTKLHSGTHSLELTKTANEFPAILHDPKSGTTIGQIAVSKGNVYTFSHYYFLDSSSGSTVRVQTVLNFSDPDGTNQWTFNNNETTTDAWTRSVVTATAPADGFVLAQVVFTSTTGSDTGTVYLDDFLLEALPGLQDYFDGSTADGTANYLYSWSGTASDSVSVATPTAGNPNYTHFVGNVNGSVAWVKSRLMAALGPSVYDLPVNGNINGGGLPDVNYINPAIGWTPAAIAESPNGVLVAGNSSGNLSNILELELDTSGGVPILTGGSTVAQLPAGESIESMQSYAGSFLIVGTSAGLRIGTFDQVGTLSLGPLTVKTDFAVYGVGGRDRFAYCSYTNQHEDGMTGIARVDLSYITDSSGRMAWAPDLRAASDALQTTGEIRSIQVLPHSGRLCFFVVGGGVYVEGNGPATTGDAWLRTSRIRYDTSTQKLWVGGKVLGDPESAFSVKITRADGTTDSHTDVDDTTGAFGFDTDLETWVQIQVNLGSGATLNSYEISAIPAPARQHMILCSALCYTSEKDRWDNVRVDPDSPRTRWNNVTALEEAGNELVFTEYASDGTTSSDNVVIDQLQFQATSPPQKSDDFGGIITFKLRIVD